MAHDIDHTKGIAAFAFKGERKHVWHGLGQEILATDDIPTITQKAGLDWTARKSPCKFDVEIPDGNGGVKKETRTFDNTSVLYRTDSGDELGIVSDNRYNIVQPADIMSFFREFLHGNGLEISTAGAVRKGRIVYATAELGKKYDFMMPGKDQVKSFVRLQTSYDGTRPTDLVHTTTRQVCANTMRMVDVDADRKGYRVRHSQVLDATNLKSAFGLLGEQHKMTAKLWNALAATAISDEEAATFFAELLDIDPTEFGKTEKNEKGKEVTVIPTRTLNQFQALANAYKNAPGASLKSSQGTAYGLLNAVTYWIDHEGTVRDHEGEGAAMARIASTQFGNGDVVKQKAQAMLAKVAGATELLKVAA